MVLAVVVHKAEQAVLLLFTPLVARVLELMVMEAEAEQVLNHLHKQVRQVAVLVHTLILELQ
jgi:hypothetical protein